MTTSTRPGVGTRTAHDPGDPLVTSHCPFCGSGQVVGRSDGTIGCDFCGQNYIVRVQPAFPGMPQMPGGPGAPSDVGPDGGMVDPGMIGPDGMPADGDGPPPGDPGDEPFDGPPDGEEDVPPPSGGDSDDDDSEDGPPPPSKSKKTSSRLYRGISGQPLSEDQLLRHVALQVTGSHPSVLARMRAESAQGEQEKAERHHYRRGWASSARAAESDSYSSPLERADFKGEPRAWYEGYHDHAGDRPKYHALTCPKGGDHDGTGGCSLQ